MDRLAFALMILAYLAWMMFVGYLCSRVRDAGWFATTALVGGVAAIIVNLASASIVIIVFVLRDDISPDSPAPCKISTESDTCFSFCPRECSCSSAPPRRW